MHKFNVGYKISFMNEMAIFVKSWGRYWKCKKIMSQDKGLEKSFI